MIILIVTHVTFQSNLSKVRWKIFFILCNMEFQLYKCEKSVISQQVVYCSFQSNILVMKLILLHFAHVCVNLYKIYESHRERTSKLAVIDVRKHLLISN